MEDFVDRDLRGSRFERVDLRGVRFRSVDLTGAVLRGAELVDADIGGDIGGLRINGVGVAPLIQAELDHRYPDHAFMRPQDVHGFREAWRILELLWSDTVRQARALPAATLHASVGGEWSFIETLRHLVFVTDSWVRRAVLGEAAPWHEWDLPWDEMPNTPPVPRDRAVTPSLDDVLAVRAERRRTVREVLDGLSDVVLDSHTDVVPGPGWPAAGRYPVRECLQCVLTEEWWHRRFAHRDLALAEMTWALLSDGAGVAPAS